MKKFKKIFVVSCAIVMALTFTGVYQERGVYNRTS
jgi:hypothetical protein